MKRLVLSVAAAGLAAATLAACGPKKSAEAPASAAMAASGGMSGMNMAPAGAKTGDSTGEITAIDQAAGTVTLKHEAIPAVGWPAMTMSFASTPSAPLAGLAVGDKVSFSVRIMDGKNEITAIRKQ